MYVLLYRGSATSFCKVIGPFYTSHQQCVRVPVPSLSALSIVSPANVRHSNAYVIVSLWDPWQLICLSIFFMYLLAFCIFSLVKCVCSNVLPFFKIWLFCLLLSCKVLYIFLNTNPLADIWLWIFFFSRFAFSLFQWCLWKADILNFDGV